MSRSVVVVRHQDTTNTDTDNSEVVRGVVVSCCELANTTRQDNDKRTDVTDQDKREELASNARALD